MIEDAPPGVDGLPTLTEVVEIGRTDEDRGVEAAGSQPPEPLLASGVAGPDGPAETVPSERPMSLPATEAMPGESGLQPQAGAPLLDEQALITRVLVELNPRIDMLFQSRLREALAPALVRAADVLIRDAREEMSASLRQLVQDAVARALQRRSDS